MARATLKAECLKRLVAAPLLLPALVLTRTEFSLWYALAVAAGMAAWLYLDGREERVALLRVKRGLCAACGYDLRASPDYCPECGTPLRPPEPPARQPPARQLAALEPR